MIEANSCKQTKPEIYRILLSKNMRKQLDPLKRELLMGVARKQGVYIKRIKPKIKDESV